MNRGRPIRPARREERADWGGFRLERIMGHRSATPGPRSALVDLPPAGIEHGESFPQTLAYFNATSTTPIMRSDRDLAIHVLWTAPDSDGVVMAGEDDGEHDSLVERRCEPGDTLLVPAEARFAIGAGIVAFMAGGGLVRPAPDSPVSPPPIEHPPTHGLNLFTGHNRRTICAATPSLLLERWKLTQPLSLHLPPDRPCYVTNLVAPVAMTWAGGAEHLDRTGSMVLSAGIGSVTFVPDGLGYVLLARVPDLGRDVISPLRSAGYNRDEIASIGVPPEFL